MIESNGSLTERRKRGTGLTERTNVSLSPRAMELKVANKINLSAWAEKFIMETCGDKVDPIRVRMVNKLEELRLHRNELDEEIKILAMSIQNRDDLKKNELPAPNFESSEALNAVFKKDLKDIQIVKPYLPDGEEK